jgi:hypothetical protein
MEKNNKQSIKSKKRKKIKKEDIFAARARAEAGKTIPTSGSKAPA